MRGGWTFPVSLCLRTHGILAAMTAAQARLADTIDVFYGAADKSSEGAMAAHAYKRGVEDLDTGIGRELVRPLRPKQGYTRATFGAATSLVCEAYRRGDRRSQKLRAPTEKSRGIRLQKTH